MKKEILSGNSMEWDFRIRTLSQIIEALNISMNELNQIGKLNKWHDAFHLLEDSEHIIGLAYIACQNYINSTIFDLFSTDEKHPYYKKGKLIKDSKTTEIQLIVAVANYYKHRDQIKKLESYTTRPLDDLGLDSSKTIEIDKSPLNISLGIISKDYSLIDLLSIVKDWRKKLIKEMNKGKDIKE